MSTTTMHFGPEWMRTKHQSARLQPSSPLPQSGSAPTVASTYSALVSPAVPPQPNIQDQANPFRYSREEMLRIYKESGGRGDHLGLEVERWEGVVRDWTADPIGLKEMDEAEKKLFSTPLNSEIRRRQSTTDYPTSLLSQSTSSERPRLGQSHSAVSGSPHRERFGGLMGRRRDSDGPSLAIPGRKVSGALPSPRDVGLPSPRSRGFDGVFPGSGEGWLARRKASQDMLRQAAVDDNSDANKTLEPSVDRDKASDSQSNHRSGPSSISELDSSSGGLSQSDQAQVTEITNGAGRISLQDTITGPNNPSAAAPPPANPTPPSDLASVEWSYLDPQGQVQGPFRADLMQKWYEDGYFTPDLPTKRTNVDANWITVSELVVRAQGGKPFLMPFIVESLPPPGLGLNGAGGASSNGNFGQGSFQTAPLPSLRTMNLDHVSTVANGLTESPASSFGAGRFGNNSPDAFGRTSSRGSYTLGDPSTTIRAAGYPAVPDMSPYPMIHREPYDMDPNFGLRSQASLGNIAARSMDMYGINGGYQTNAGGWISSNGASAHGYGQYNMGRAEPSPFSMGYVNQNGVAMPSQNGVNRSHSIQDAYGNVNGASTSFNPSYAQPTQSTSNDTANMSFAGLSQPGPAPVSQTTPFAINQPRTEAASNPLNPVDQPSVPAAPLPSPWKNPKETTEPLARANPFDAPHPKASNTVPVVTAPIPQGSAWNRAAQSSRSSSQHNDVSPWFAASHENDDDTWKEPVGPNSLTFSNVVQHNQQQQQETQTEAASAKDAPPVQSEAEAQKPTALPTPAPSAAPTPAKPRRKSTSQPAQKVATATAPVPPLPTKNPSPPPSARPAWSTDDDQKKSSLSLREIQEAEAKQAESRKAAEREKERTPKAPSISTDDAQPFTASWGLPISQAGSRGNLSVKETTTASSPSSVASPVWTTPAKTPVAKKSMKEIQEEEQRRKQLTVKETAASAVKRGYAETTTKALVPAQSPAAAPVSNAWSVVGPNGKAVASTRPPGAVATPTPPAASTSRPNGTTVSRPSTATASKPSFTAIPATAKVDDYPINPSHDFLRWLSDSLKGLSNSVNVEDIMQMLLSFPLDPDPSTTEIISDLIYAHSTTLDGRRFAAEFINKRKTDAASRPKGTPNGNVANKPISIADVVKSQPKPSQPEWGGFKVVKKKNKGGRS
ncbi:hypothetical protein ONZ45_g2628 [Pleurotus djamor]|nr:hypothetical protein ONZ45_g2628 [Pleurotus djamor]